MYATEDERIAGRKASLQRFKLSHPNYSNGCYQKRFNKNPSKVREYSRIWAAKWRKDNPERAKAAWIKHRLKHRDKINAKSRQKRLDNLEEERAREREWYKHNKSRKLAKRKQERLENSPKYELAKARTRKWRKENWRHVLEYKRRTWRNELLTNPVKYRLEHALRNRINQAIRRQYGKKSNRTMVLTGCSLNELKFHLESQFREGMTWENRGKTWHIDHIVPCAFFDLTKPSHQLACFHFSNLQPLFIPENLAKGSKILPGVIVPFVAAA